MSLGMVVPPVKNHKPIGYCIYCGNRPPLAPLTKEHVIPYAFGGHHVLPQASCLECCKVTHAIEGQCCDKMFKALRLHRNIQTRRPKFRKHYLPVKASNRALAEADWEFDLSIPSQDAPGICMFPMFLPPRMIALYHWPWQTGVRMFHTTDNNQEKFSALRDAGRGESFSISTSILPLEFSRVLAKIAHCYLFMIYGPLPLHYLLPQIILGENKNIEHYVGGVEMHEGIIFENDQTIEHPNHMINHSLSKINNDMIISVYIQLFCSIFPKSPVYQVIAAELKDFIAYDGLSKT